MHDSQQQEQVLHISGDGNGSVTVSLESAEPVTVRLKIDAKCGCQDERSSANRPGSYVYTEPAGHRN
jgi:hypothetical protein